MPRQEHLSQACGALAGRGRPQRPRAWPAALTRRGRVLRQLLAALLFLFLLAGLAPAAALDAPGFEGIEAARADPASPDTPPAEGWTAVTLPDAWAGRWPAHDGVVWYRLRWNEPATAGAPAPRGLAMDYLSMAGAIYLNGALLARDPQLEEPLSRSWNHPRHWLLSAPLLRPGPNELLVRVSGLAAYAPGLGPVLVDSPAAADAHYRHERLIRESLHMLSLGITLAMGVLYGLFWLLRRNETFYGWFSLFSLLWVPVGYNYVARSTWPFGSTDTYQAVNMSALVLGTAAFLMFALRFCGLRRRRAVQLIGGAVGLTTAALWLAPHAHALLSPVRGAAVVVALATYTLSAWIICRHALASPRRREVQALALCTLLPLAAGTHDVLVFHGVLATNLYYTPWSSSAMLVGISFVLTWRFVVGMRLVEHFNDELRHHVEDATRRLSSMLHREHATELQNTRLAERMNLVRDLHDGLGMTLSGHIASLENRSAAGHDTALWALKEVRDDLRLIIESSSLDDTDRLSERIAPLRHRTTRVLEAAGIECTWALQGLDQCRLDDRRGLDFLRLLQEALANVLKHSRASKVRIGIEAADGQLSLSVADDGSGFTAGRDAHGGMGLRNMEARARRLNGTLDIRPTPDGTTVALRFPVELPAG
ncbi:7TM diverse intracellular signaling domain-containing protein [Variovorax sp. V59]|uniref:sensor histidine kinase n=1 Tax=unclassified Variovorax TaxID=663243 RepID=UPI0034E982F8